MKLRESDMVKIREDPTDKSKLHVRVTVPNEIFQLFKDHPAVLNEAMLDAMNNESPLDIDEGQTLRQFHGRTDHERYLNHIKLEVLSPILFGTSHQPEMWLKYAVESKLLPSIDVEKTFGENVAIDDRYLHVAKILEETLELIPSQQREKRMNDVDLKELFNDIDQSIFPFLEANRTPRPLEWVLQISQKFKFLHDMKNDLSAIQTKIKPDPRIVLDDIQLVVCILFVLRHFLSYVMGDSKGRLQSFEELMIRVESTVEDLKEKGNDCFKNKKFHLAVNVYTKAIDKSRYNAKLYGNRAQSYSYISDYLPALSDSLRSITLSPKWHKGYYRCAVALYNLGQLQRAADIVVVGIRNCAPDKHLVFLKDKYTKELEEKASIENGTAEANITSVDEGMPELVDSSDNDSDNETNENLMYTNFIRKQTEETRRKELKEKLKNEPKRKEEEQKRKELKERKQRELERKLREEEQKKQRKFETERREKERKKREDDRRKDEDLKKKRAEEAEEKQEQERKNKVMRDKAERDQRHTELYEQLADASRALIENRINNALMLYTRATDHIAKYSLAYLNQFKEFDQVLAKYALGEACVRMGTNKEILQGMTQFNEILEKHNSVKFPLAYLGLGRAFHRQNRFKEALVPLTKGLTVVKKAVNHSVLTWPGSQLVIEETKDGMLLSTLQELINTCVYPSRPEATCRFRQCSGHYKIQIYISDPDLKGFVRLRCYARCRIEYHIDCWRKFKKGLISNSDKDYLNYKCMTPNCNALISDIHIYDQHGVIDKKMHNPDVEKLTSTISKPVKFKMKTTNQRKLARKLERKAKSKEYKKQLQLAAAANDNLYADNNNENNIEGLDIIGDLQDGVAPGMHKKSSSPLLSRFDHSPVMILKKGYDDDVTEHRGAVGGKTKKAKRKDRTKQTMHLDEFVGRDDDIYEDENGVLHRTNTATAGHDLYSRYTTAPHLITEQPLVEAPISSYRAAALYGGGGVGGGIALADLTSTINTATRSADYDAEVTSLMQ